MTARVLVVDDSAFARTVIARMLRSSGLIDVVGTARNGFDALSQIESLDPDLVTLDLSMPELDGIGVLRALQGRRRPRVLVVSVSTLDSAPAAEALALGAIDLVVKPNALASNRLYELGQELVAKVLGATATADATAKIAEPTRPSAASGRPCADLVMIGTSTGGPQALTRVLAALPADLSAPVAMVLHIPVGYTEALAQRLDGVSPLHVVEAHDGLELRPGVAVLARAGQHLHVESRDGRLVARLVSLPLRSHVPSVDELFLSGASAVGAGAMGVVLTGMGDDGLEGARAIAAAGGTLLTESVSTCVVYGMPRSVFEAGLGARSAPLDQIPREIIEHVTAH